MERKKDESFESYKSRRNKANKETKKLRHGVEFHDVGYYGSYENPEKRKLQAERKARRDNKRNAI